MVLGAVVANLAPERDRTRIYRTLGQWEKPVYVILLMLAGAYLSFPTWWVAPLALGYALLRAIGKVLGMAILLGLVRLPFPVPRRTGLGLIPQGGISLAMALSLRLTLRPGGLQVGEVDAVDVLFAVIVLGVVLSELVGPFLTVQVLRRAGEISPRVERAIQEGDESRATAEAMRHHEPATTPGEGPGGEPPARPGNGL
jgi:NhaP-type Na+/H+ or K+/H+ antiporter